MSAGVSSAVAYLHHHFTDHGVTLDRAAAVAHLSRYHFSRTFREQTGHRFIDYLTALRMAEAQALLADTDLPVTEVCRRVGYLESSHFTRTFRALHGVSPAGYRAGRRLQAHSITA
jgi:AraC-like DNA-binding protein